MGASLVDMPLAWAQCNFDVDTWAGMKSFIDTVADEVAAVDWSGQTSSYAAWSVTFDAVPCAPQGCTPGEGLQCPGGTAQHMSTLCGGSTYNSYYSGDSICAAAAACASAVHPPGQTLNIEPGCLSMTWYTANSSAQSTGWVDPSTITCGPNRMGTASFSSWNANDAVAQIVYVVKAAAAALATVDG